MATYEITITMHTGMTIPTVIDLIDRKFKHVSDITDIQIDVEYQ